MSSIDDHRSLLLSNTSAWDRLLGRMVMVWISRAREVGRCMAAFRSPLAVAARMARNGPWPYSVELHDGRHVILESSRDAWMFAHSFGSPEFRLTRLSTGSDKVTQFEFEGGEPERRVLIWLPPGVGDPGIFLSGEYGYLEPRGRTVVDIGAGAGESAIYFVLRGAARVLAYEPMPVTFEYAEQNIRANGLELQIRLHREAVGARVGEVGVGRELTTATVRALSAETGNIRTAITTLTKIVETEHLEDACLKVDCEGDEYGLLLTTPPAILRHFRFIVVEYHFGSDSLLNHLMKAGFRVRASRPNYSPKSPHPGVYYGLISATREVSADASD